MNPRLAAIASAILFSTGGAAIKSTSLTSWQISGLRSLVAALAVLILLPETRKHWTWRSGVVAIAYALCLTSFVLATKNTTAANAIFLQATAPVYLVLLGPWLLGEKVRTSDWTTLAIVVVGMVLVFWDPGQAQALAERGRLSQGDLRGRLDQGGGAREVRRRGQANDQGHHPGRDEPRGAE